MTATVAATVSAVDARRLLMQGAGLLERTDQPATSAVLHDVLDHLGYVQLDTINTVVRAHEHILHTRLDNYVPGDLLHALAAHRRLFEHWTHDASVIPVACLPAWMPRFEAYRARIPTTAWWTKTLGRNAKRLIAEVLEHVEAHGEVMSRDFERQDSKAGTWWGWKPQKAALEYLWRSGELAIARREGFQKVFAPFDSVYPHVRALIPFDVDAQVEWTCRCALDRHTFATAKELAEFHALIKSPQARAWAEAAADRGEIERVEVSHARDGSSTVCYATPDWRERRDLIPATDGGTIRVLSPFDPICRDRARLERLFGFTYRFEAFVPAPKRVYGYYVLPVLEGDRMIGRLDAKTDRQAGELRVLGVWWESGVRPTAARQKRLERALSRLSAFAGGEGRVVGLGT
ncbi:MAG: crosslink repair DNA glycosylase YcaQ family protein [Planctomycetota bacterium]